jgi:hypothetical protein
VRFKKGDVKEDIAREYFKRAERDGRFGVVLIGVAQEKPRRGAGGATGVAISIRTSCSPARRCS